MTYKPPYLLPALALSAITLAGCVTDTKTNTNANAVVNTSVNNTNTVTNTTTANDNVNEAIANTNLNENSNTEVSDLDTSDWQTYTNEKYGFSFKYPKDWQISNDIFEEYKKSYDNPRYQVNTTDIVFATSLDNADITAEIDHYKSLTDVMGVGVMESVARGKLISVAVSDLEVSDLVSEQGFAFTIGDTTLLDNNIVATNVYLKKSWEGNSNYHYIYIPLPDAELTNMGKPVQSVVFTMETNNGNYDQNDLLNIVHTFQTNS